jgi:site-specific DNA-methyltransferase (adenine-specific)
MTHFSENSHRLTVDSISVENYAELSRIISGCPDVLALRLPARLPQLPPLTLSDRLAFAIAANLPRSATLIVLGETSDLVQFHSLLSKPLQYHLWIAIKRKTLKPPPDLSALSQHHFGALVYTRRQTPFQHTKTRIEYTYCPACNKTTKDYGGKKHTYHEYGTLMSDVWRDIACDLEDDISPVIERFADVFGIEKYHRLLVIDLRACDCFVPGLQIPVTQPETLENTLPEQLANTLLRGDCLQELRRIPDSSVDFAFADPPYNLGKSYADYSDDLAISPYFSWCDHWLSELARVLRPERTCAVLNIPLWGIRYFLHMQTILRFQNWIAWDALSFPVRFIMPAHYAILCFTKGEPRPLPGLLGEAGPTETPFMPRTFRSLAPLAEGYCLRGQCVQRRKTQGIEDRGMLTDIWWDIHRLKHNSKRVDHPCQLPPQLMYRLISIFTKPGEVVLDCFNGAGTTTLAAHQLGRAYIGIEASEKYHSMALERHKEIEQGMDPFRKEERVLTAKNSPVARLPKKKYEIPKKTLQLEVKRVSKLLGHIPSREELIAHGRYPIRYYDEYFSSWGEVCAAARTTGMSENKQPVNDNNGGVRAYQPHLFPPEQS